mmetsp:Transcript_46256/g.122721  ORF Transcript_46256/g.122721 Transcript_46256/m.122721 type:complete len:227 (+) Transcript_46256:364-1044(+)
MQRRQVAPIARPWRLPDTGGSPPVPLTGGALVGIAPPRAPQTCRASSWQPVRLEFWRQGVLVMSGRSCGRKQWQLRVIPRDLLPAFSLEEMVCQTALCGEPVIWVPGHHAVHQLDTIWPSVVHDGLQLRGHQLRPTVAHLRGQFEPFGPVSLSRGAENGTDLEHLVHLGLPRKERSKSVQFSHDAAARPKIQRRIVHGASQEDLWCPVPPSRNVIGEGRSGSDLPR